ncbi:MAG: NADH-quinone oxidoreductase subunit NuoE [Desulfuromonadaceae bacterium]|nr:NADH-quinone oxidoreductase subunit NuoE [Desulfuromonadaceae bacterium]MDD5106612.1 NADH-quinone oxidoreductase subunit NuoE [Desulfuromonadaceae bacterium]
MIPENMRQELQNRIASAVTNREAAVDVMKSLQAHYGWLTDEAVVEAAELLGLTPLQIEELATFYEMIYRRPVGRYVIHVCDSISCWAMGGETVMGKIAGLLGISVGGTTADGLFTLLPCCCLGNCGQSPTLMIGDTIYNRVTAESAAELIEQYRNP